MVALVLIDIAVIAAVAGCIIGFDKLSRRGKFVLIAALMMLFVITAKTNIELVAAQELPFADCFTDEDFGAEWVSFEVGADGKIDETTAEAIPDEFITSLWELEGRLQEFFDNHHYGFILEDKKVIVRIAVSDYMNECDKAQIEKSLESEWE